MRTSRPLRWTRDYPLCELYKSYQRSSQRPLGIAKFRGCPRKAILPLPGLHEATMLLSQYLLHRFKVAPSDDDHVAAMVILEAVLTFRGPRNEPNSHRMKALKLAAQFADSRFEAYGKPQYLYHAIYRHRAMLDGTFINGPHRGVIIVSSRSEVENDGAPRRGPNGGTERNAPTKERCSHEWASGGAQQRFEVMNKK